MKQGKTSTGLYRSCAALAYFLGTINWNKKKEKLEYYLKEFYYWINLWKGLVWFGLVWFGLIWYGLALFGLVWFGQSTDKQTNKINIQFLFNVSLCVDRTKKSQVWFGLVELGLVYSNLVWFGKFTDKQTN